MTSSAFRDRFRSLTCSSLVIAGLVLSSVVVPAFAQQSTFRSSWKMVEPLENLVVENGEIRLELEDAIAIALAQNLGLQIQRYDRAMALFNVDERSAIYDLFLTSNLTFSEETSPSASQLDGANIQQSESQALNLRLDQLISTGGTASLDWGNFRRESNSFFAQINPSYTVNFDLLFSQPLLQGFGKDITERGIKLASLDSSISKENLELAVANTIQAVEEAYWSVVEAREQLKVSRESLALTEQLHEMNRIQVDVGTKAPLELIQSEAGIATRQEEIIRNQALVEDAGDQLRQLLNIQSEEAWLASIVPTTPPETERIEVDLEESLAVAEQERRELAIQQLALEQLELDARFFRNAKLPQLNFDLRYGYNGLGGDIRVIDGDIFDPDAPVTIFSGGYSDALGQVTDLDFEGWSAGFSLRYPIQNRSARANSAIANLNLDRGQLQLRETKLGIRTEVRRAARAVLTAAEQIDSAGASRNLQEKNVEAEQKRYENGLSTSFEVLEIQEDLANARRSEVSAIAGYRIALTSYYRAIGRLLEQKGIVLEHEDDTSALQPE